MGIFFIMLLVLIAPIFAFKYSIGVYGICGFGLSVMVLLIYELAKLTSGDSYKRPDARVDYPDEDKPDLWYDNNPLNDNLLISNARSRPKQVITLAVTYNDRNRQMKYEELRQKLLKKINKVREICEEAKVDQDKAADIYREYVEAKDDIEALNREARSSHNRRIGDKK